MRIISCDIENFGCLSNYHMDFKEGINVVCEDNGFGKSTLAAFIRIMFFGFLNQGKRDDLINERMKYKPWQGGVYGGKITFLMDDKTYIISKCFGNKEQEDTVFIRDGITNVEVKHFSKNPGEEIFGIDSQAFLRTSFISQNDCDYIINDSINARLSNMTDNQNDVNNYDKVDTELKNILNSMSPDKKTGSIYKLRDTIEYAKEHIRKLPGIEADIKKLEYQLECAYKKEADNDEKLANYHKKVAELRVNISACKERERIEKLLIKEQSELEDKKTQLEHIENKSIQKSKTNILPVVIPAIVAVVAFIIAFYNLIIGIIIGIADILAVAFMLIVRNRKKVYISEMDEIICLRQEIKTREEQLNKMRSHFFTEVQSGNVSVYERQLQEINDKITSLKSENRLTSNSINDYNNSIQCLSEEYDEISAYKEELNVLNAQYEEDREKFRLLTLTREMLMEAKIAFGNRYLNPVKEGFDKYYNILTGIESSEYFLNAVGDINVEKNGIPRDRKYMSSGLKDLIGICMRMSLVDAIYNGSPPFIIMDDPFVNLDDDKINKGLKLMEEIGKEYQIIYFTCSRSRV